MMMAWREQKASSSRGCRSFCFPLNILLYSTAAAMYAWCLGGAVLWGTKGLLSIPCGSNVDRCSQGQQVVWPYVPPQYRRPHAPLAAASHAATSPEKHNILKNPSSHHVRVRMSSGDPFRRQHLLVVRRGHRSPRVLVGTTGSRRRAWRRAGS